jgi:hypothetical protein
MQGGKAPTAAQKRRMESLHKTGCRACWKCDASTGHVLEVHHLTDCGRRRGHDFTISLCAYHHRGVPIEGWTRKDMEKIWGPSVAGGSRPFKERFGADDELLAIQNDLLSKLPKGK